MSFAYYKNEIPLAKKFIRNYLIFRCTEWRCISPEVCGATGSTGRSLIGHLRDTWRYIINREKTQLFLDSFKQYLETLDLLESPSDYRPVSATVFKRLLYKERRVLKLIPGKVDKRKYPIKYTVEEIQEYYRQIKTQYQDTFDIIDFIRSQENLPIP